MPVSPPQHQGIDFMDVFVGSLALERARVDQSVRFPDDAVFWA
jgi:hypothetical protein